MTKQKRYQAKSFTLAVINSKTRKIVSRHLRLQGAMKGLADAGGFDTHELIDL